MHSDTSLLKKSNFSSGSNEIFFFESSFVSYQLKSRDKTFDAMLRHAYGAASWSLTFEHGSTLVYVTRRGSYEIMRSINVSLVCMTLVAISRYVLG